MRSIKRQFRPSALMTLITLAGVVLFTGLGVWQLERAALKRAIVERYEANLNADFVPLTRYHGLQEMEYQRVILKGRWDFQRTLLLDNQLSRGRAGYHVITPFIVDAGKVLLVNRGWVALGSSRQQLPVIMNPDQAGEIRGILVKPAAAGFRLGEITLDQSWPKVIPFVDIDRLQMVYSGELLPMMLWLSSKQEDFYERDWQPVWQAPEKSEAYALQWFLFAIIATILFILLNYRKTDE